MERLMLSRSAYWIAILAICVLIAAVTTAVARHRHDSRAWAAAGVIALVLAALGYADWHGQAIRECPLGGYFLLAVLLPATGALVATLAPRSWPSIGRWLLGLVCCILASSLGIYASIALL
jgi:hypothetical protein